MPISSQEVNGKFYEDVELLIYNGLALYTSCEIFFNIILLGQKSVMRVGIWDLDIFLLSDTNGKMQHMMKEILKRKACKQSKR